MALLVYLAKFRPPTVDVNAIPSSEFDLWRRKPPCLAFSFSLFVTLWPSSPALSSSCHWSKPVRLRLCVGRPIVSRPPAAFLFCFGGDALDFRRCASPSSSSCAETKSLACRSLRRCLPFWLFLIWSAKPALPEGPPLYAAISDVITELAPLLTAVTLWQQDTEHAGKESARREGGDVQHAREPTRFWSRAHAPEDEAPAQQAATAHNRSHCLQPSSLEREVGPIRGSKMDGRFFVFFSCRYFQGRGRGRRAVA